MAEFVSTYQAAATLGLTPRRIQQLCRTGTIGFLVGGRYVISAADVEGYRRLGRGPDKKPRKRRGSPTNQPAGRATRRT